MLAPRVTAPMLWVAGRDSPVMKSLSPIDYQERIACFANVQEIVIDDCGHNLHHDQAGADAQRLEEFLQHANGHRWEARRTAIYRPHAMETSIHAHHRDIRAKTVYPCSPQGRGCYSTKRDRSSLFLASSVSRPFNIRGVDANRFAPLCCRR